MSSTELLTRPQASEQAPNVDPPPSGASPPIHHNAGVFLVLAWLRVLKFGALMLLVAVMVAPLFPGLVVLGLVCAILAPPYLVLRHLRGGA